MQVRKQQLELDIEQPTDSKLEKPEDPEIKLPTSIGSLKRQESDRKIFTFALLNMPKPLTV